MTEAEAKELNALRLVAKAALELEGFLGKNAGDNADWPVALRCQDQETADRLTQLLQNLKDRLLAL